MNFGTKRAIFLGKYFKKHVKDFDAMVDVDDWYAPAFWFVQYTLFDDL